MWHLARPGLEVESGSRTLGVGMCAACGFCSCPAAFTELRMRLPSEQLSAQMSIGRAWKSLTGLSSGDLPTGTPRPSSFASSRRGPPLPAVRQGLPVHSRSLVVLRPAQVWPSYMGVGRRAAQLRAPAAVCPALPVVGLASAGHPGHPASVGADSTGRAGRYCGRLRLQARTVAVRAASREVRRYLRGDLVHDICDVPLLCCGSHSL